MNIEQGYWLVVSHGPDRCFVEVPLADDDDSAIITAVWKMQTNRAIAHDASAVLYHNGTAIKQLIPRVQVSVIDV